MESLDEKVKIWQGDLDPWNRLLPEWEKLLSPDERERAQRYHFEKDRRHFTASRALLRLLLGNELQQSADSLTFDYSEYGRPFLKEGGPFHSLNFNLSHSNGRFLLAIARKRRIGVDLEFIRPDVSFDSIAGRYFAEEEKEALAREPEEGKALLFFRYWTLKEAFMKAQGKGLSYSLNRFSVGWNLGESHVALAIRDEPGEASRWSLSFLQSPATFVAALAVEGRETLLELHS
jgi:4'-phosphopantetheinyl transferase